MRIKIIVLILTVFAAHVSASSYAQKITIHKKNVSLSGGYPKSGHLFLSKVATYYAPKWSAHFGQK
jgi:hypothetical protein